MNNLDILLRFLLDQSSLSNVEGGGKRLVSTLEAIEKKAFQAQIVFGVVGDAADAMFKTSQKAFIAGTAFTGLLIAEANQYAKKAGDASAATRQWNAEMASLGKSRERIDAVLVQEALPLLRLAANVAEKASAFVEAHPEIVRAALNAGVVVAGLGAVGMAVARGIKLVADIGYLAAVGTQLTAAKMMDAAANKQLLASGKGVGGALAGAGSFLSKAGPIGGIVVGGLVVAGLNAVIAQELGLLEKGLAKVTQNATLATNAINFLSSTMGSIPGLNLVPTFRILGAKLPELQKILEKLGISTENTSDALKPFGENTEAVVEAFSKMNEAEQQAIQNYNEARADIIADGARAMQEAIRDNADAIARINANFTTTVARINTNYNTTVANIIRDAATATRQAEIQNAAARARIIRDAGIEIQRIEQDHQERMRQLQEEHDSNMYNLAASRDALGLVKEQERFNKAQGEAERKTNEEIAQRRQDLRIRLQDQAQAAAAERAQRAEQMKQQLADAAARHAQELKDARDQRAEQLKEQAKAFAEQQRRIRQQEADKLRDLNESYRREQLQRRNAFIAFVRDLDASLTGERGLKQRYYNQMLADAERFLAEYRRRLPGGSGVGTVSGGAAPLHDYTGYAYPGLYAMAQNGQRQFVLSGSATRAAEQIVGGRLSEQAVMNRMGNSRQMIYNDYRTISGDVSPALVRKIQQDAIEAMNYVLTGSEG